MSDLEDRGIIDRQQKGVLKDLIISGDDDLQAALDKWDGGDKSALESIVEALKTRKSSDIDLLGDLDLDFLSMNADFGEASAAAAQIASKAIPIPGKSKVSMQHPNSRKGSDSGSGTSTPQVRGQSPAQAPYDSIGELDFNGDYVGAVEPRLVEQGTFTEPPYNQPPVQMTTRTRANSLAFEGLLNELQRNRSNSLAFGGLLDEPNSVFQDNVGKWMDRTPVPIPEENKPLKKRVSSHVVGANGGLYIINNSSQEAQPPPDISKMTKAEIAAMKRREREEKKATREADKLAKKEKKETDSKLKKTNKSPKQDKKSKKSESAAKRKKDEASASASDDEQRVIVSGTGRPRALSDPNLSIGLDENGLMHIEHPPDWVGAYSPESRRIRIERFMAKRDHRVWVKKVKYDVRKNFADSRLRVKGRFVKKEDELLMRDLMGLT